MAACEAHTGAYVQLGTAGVPRPVAPGALQCDPATSDVIPVPGAGGGDVPDYQCACKPELATMFEAAADGASCDVPTVCDGGYLASAHPDDVQTCKLPTEKRSVELEPRLVVTGKGAAAARRPRRCPRPWTCGRPSPTRTAAPRARTRIWPSSRGAPA